MKKKRIDVISAKTAAYHNNIVLPERLIEVDINSSTYLGRRAKRRFVNTSSIT